MQVATLPRRGDRLGKGGFGEVFVDPSDATRCIKVFDRPLTGAAAARMLELVELGHRARPSDGSLLVTRFGWPLEAFGSPGKIVGYRMPRAPESAMFDLVVSGRETRQLLQAKFVFDVNYWGGAAIQSAAPTVLPDDRLLIARDLIRSLLQLHRLGFVYTDLSSNNVALRLDEPAGVFLLDVDSVLRLDETSAPPVRTPDWMVPATLTLEQQDWTKAAIFVWRLLVQSTQERPDPARIQDFERRAGKPLGPAVLELHEQADDPAALRLIDALIEALSPLGQDQLIDDAVASRFARRILEVRGVPAIGRYAGLVEAAEAQIEAEDRVAAASGLQLRLLLRGLRGGRGPFDLDVPGRIGEPIVPTSVAEFEDLVLKARFDDLVEQFSTGALSAFAKHPWLSRAVEHALAVEPAPVLEETESAGGHDVRFRWPSSPLIDRALIRVWSGKGLTDEHLVRREPSRATVRIQNLGRGRPPGSMTTLQVAFGVSADDGDPLILCPSSATVRFQVPVDAAAEVRQRRWSGREGASAAEYVLDMAYEDPEIHRRRVRSRIATAAAGLLLIAGTVTWLLLRGPEEGPAIEAVVVASDGPGELSWVQRAPIGQGLRARSFAVQERLFGVLWWRDVSRAITDAEVGEIVDVTLPSGAGPVRVEVELLDGRRIATGALEPVPAPAGARGPLPAPGSPSIADPESPLLLVWPEPSLGPARLVAGYQIRALDRAGNPVFDATSLLPSVRIPAAVLAAAPRGLEVSVRARTADGVLTAWTEPILLRTAGSALPAPALRLSTAADGVQQVSWTLADAAGTPVEGLRFDIETTAADGRSGRREATAAQLAVADLQIGTGAVSVRVRAIAGDGSRSPWSEPLTLPARPGSGD